MSPRRPTKNITAIKGGGFVDYTTVWRVLECSKPGCDCLLKVSEDMEGFGKNSVKCPSCSYEITPDVILRAPRWKYCRICEWLQPIDYFHKHKPTSKGFRSGRQLECAVCKNTKINPFLNPLRTADQHCESSQRRRLYGLLAGEEKINSLKIYGIFEGKCFNCGKPLKQTTKGENGFRMDHTLPAKYFWPLSTGPTILCAKCNNEKHEKWPSEYYKEKKIRELSVLTGISYKILKGEPFLNPSAIKRLVANIDDFIKQWIKYPEEVKRARNLVLEKTGKDLFKLAKVVPKFLRNDT